MNKASHLVVVSLVLILVTFPFQNCGQSFKSGTTGFDYSSLSNIVVVPLGVEFADFKTCRVSSATTNDDLAACLNSFSKNAGFKATALDTCDANGAKTDLALAMCLSKSGPVVFNHRAPKQMDIEFCNGAVGAANISKCLHKRGVLSGVLQAQIDSCISKVTLSGVEKCLRANNAIPRQGILLQGDVNICVAISGSNSDIGACLLNSELVPTNVLQSDIDACITAVGLAGVSRCLRNNYKVSKVIMQPHLADCARAVGNANISTCLESNGLYTIPAAAPDLQLGINNCITANGGTVANLARCMRTNNLVPAPVTQAAISLCAGIAGQTGIFNCLNANFPATEIPAGLTQVAIDSCISTANVGLPLTKRCLTSVRKIFNDVPIQADINSCAAYAGNAPSGANPSQVGIAACLNTQGLSLGTLTQLQIDGCITAVGLTGVEACLYNRGHIGSYQRLLTGVAPQNVFARCTTCHAAAGGSGNLSIANHAQVLLRLVPGSPDTSPLFNRVLRNVAGFNPMPPAAGGALTTEEIERVRTWIAQGARNN